MERRTMTIHEILHQESQRNGKKSDCPLEISVIPNYMGINLVSVESISWQRQDDGQLIDLTINFIPDNEKNI